MVTRAEPDESPPTRRQRVERTARGVIAGHEDGAVRRVILYIIAAGCITAVIWSANLGGNIGTTIIGEVGITALLLLALTDQFV